MKFCFITISLSSQGVTNQWVVYCLAAPQYLEERRSESKLNCTAGPIYMQENQRICTYVYMHISEKLGLPKYMQNIP